MLNSELIEEYNRIINQTDVTKNVITIGKTPEKYQSREDFIKAIFKWCCENKVEKFKQSGNLIWFSKVDDALKFKLSANYI